MLCPACEVAKGHEAENDFFPIPEGKNDTYLKRKFIWLVNILSFKKENDKIKGNLFLFLLCFFAGERGFIY